MKAQLIKAMNGYYIATFMFDDAPPGFEDFIEESTFIKLIRVGRAFAEYGTPDITHMTSRSNQAISRYLTIEDRNICGHLLAQEITDGFTVSFKPIGPMAARAMNDLCHPTGRCGLRFRMLTDFDEDTQVSTIQQIITADFIQF